MWFTKEHEEIKQLKRELEDTLRERKVEIHSEAMKIAIETFDNWKYNATEGKEYMEMRLQIEELKGRCKAYEACMKNKY